MATVTISKSSAMSIINRNAWALLKAQAYATWGDAFRAAKFMLENGMSEAISDEAAIALLSKGICLLVFKKKDGSVTERVATRKSDIVAKHIGTSNRKSNSLFFLEQIGDTYVAKSASFGSVISCKLLS